MEKTETWGPERGRKLGGGKERKEEKEGKVEKRVCWKEENREEEKKKGEGRRRKEGRGLSVRKKKKSGKCVCVQAG